MSINKWCPPSGWNQYGWELCGDSVSHNLHSKEGLEGRRDEQRWDGSKFGKSFLLEETISCTETVLENGLLLQ